MIIGIIGSRSRNSTEDYELVKAKFFEIYNEGDIICSGGCGIGGDRFAKYIHEAFKIPYLEFPANWTKYGKKAGFLRNVHIAKWSDILIVCQNPNEPKGGTAHTVERFLACKPRDKVIFV